MGDALYWDPIDPSLRVDPYPLWKRLRDEAPVYHNDRYDFWALSRFPDVELAHKHPETFSSAHTTTFEMMTPEPIETGMILWLDPPKHTLLRKLVSRAFTSRRVSMLEDRIRTMSARLLDAQVGTDGFDYVQDFSAILPPMVISSLLGVPEADQDRLRHVVDDIFHIEEGVGMRNPISQGARETLPVILFLHGGGWVLGNAGTHDRLVREVAVGAHAAVAFLEYPLSPEARYPAAIEQAYATASWIAREGAIKGLDDGRIAVAGDSVGGNMATVLTLMAKERGDVEFLQAQLYYPVTDAAMDTASYEEFADGPYNTRKTMEWFWDAYIADPAQRLEITASPNQASIAQLQGLPPHFVLVDEPDVLRDEGEAYAAKLRQAGVPVTTVRYEGIVHDFMNVNALSQTSSARAAIAQAVSLFRQAFETA